MSARYELIGLTASPYSMKIRALMRYRRIPVDWIVEMPQLTGRKVAVSPILLPVLRHPMGRDLTDSTTIATVLEAEIVNDRGTIPPGDQAFLCHLIEDMADEWLTKAMFWYRWRDDNSASFATSWIAAEVASSLPNQTAEGIGPTLRKRQSGRMPMIGATAENGPVIEATYRAVLAALRPICAGQGYLFGTRPSLADFALFGQLSQLALDPAAAEIMRVEAPEVLHWLRRIDDASGLDGEWVPESLDGLLAILTIIGTDYLPFLAANADALQASEQVFQVDLGSGSFTNMPYRWQGKCLTRLREMFVQAELSAPVRGLLARTGCLDILQA